MPRDDYDHYDEDEVEVQGPAMKEIRRTRSCMRRSCFSGCGCFIFLFVVIIAGFWLFAPPQPKALTVLPPNFPSTLPLYKAESITTIEFTAAQRKKRGPETAALIPKIILAPVFLALDDSSETTTEPGKEAGRSAWHAFTKIVKSPIKEYTSTAQLTWESLPAPPDFVDEWYQNELNKAGFNVDRKFTSSTLRSINFDGPGVHGYVEINDRAQTSNTDEVIILLEYQSGHD